MKETAWMPLPLLAPGARLEVFEQQVSVKVDINGAVPGSASGASSREILINSYFFFVVFRVDRKEGVVPMYVAAARPARLQGVTTFASVFSCRPSARCARWCRWTRRRSAGP
eukprot:3937795-Rhodomonas_salina.1